MISSILFSDLGSGGHYGARSSIFELIPPGSPLRDLLSYLSVGLLIIFIIKLLDKKYIDVSNGVLSTYTKPFSISKPKKYKINQIKQIYVKKQNKNEGLDDLKELAQQFYGYTLMAILKNEKTVNLFQTVNGKDATYLENLIEDYLGIEDVRVKGELEY